MSRKVILHLEDLGFNLLKVSTSLESYESEENSQH